MYYIQIKDGVLERLLRVKLFQEVQEVTLIHSYCILRVHRFDFMFMREIKGFLIKIIIIYILYFLRLK